jgi:predicted RND superfamily exporter protein
VGAIWRELEALLAEESQPDDPIELSFLGYRTMSYLFTEHGLKWMRITAVVALATVLALAALFLRAARALLIVFLLAVTSGLVWFALLQIAGIYLSIFLLFPLVFAMSIGSDYGLHFLCRLRAARLRGEDTTLPPARGRDPHSVWYSTSRAVAIAALTDAGVFLIYSRTALVSASQVMIAVALAVAAVFACTALLIPALAGRASINVPPDSASAPEPGR